jgi:hypothetical protein
MFGKDVFSPVLDSTPTSSVKLVFSAQAVSELSALTQEPLHDYTSTELVGLIFGSNGPGLVHVETVRQLPGHAPGLLFEKFTRKQFDDVLRAVSLDPLLEPFQLLGWYRVHHDRDLRLLPAEVSFHERYFPRHEDLGLLLAPDKNGPIGCVCARSQDGIFSPTQHSEATVHLDGRKGADVSAELESGPLFSENTYIKAYETLENTEKRQTLRKRVLLGGLCVLVFAAAIGISTILRSLGNHSVGEGSGPGMSLALSCQGSDLRISWTGGIPKPTQAQLKVLDGNSVAKLDLLANYKPDGSITLKRQSGNIQALLFVSDGFRNWESGSSLVDWNISDTPPKPESTEDEAARAELAKLKQENQKLQNQVNALRRQRPSRRSRR